MRKEYLHKEFASIEAFEAHNRALANDGDESAVRRVATFIRIEQDRLYHQSAGRGSDKADIAEFCAGAFLPEALIQK